MSLLSSLTGIDIRVSGGRIVRFRVRDDVRAAVVEWMMGLLRDAGADAAVLAHARELAEARMR